MAKFVTKIYMINHKLVILNSTEHEMIYYDSASIILKDI